MEEIVTCDRDDNTGTIMLINLLRGGVMYSSYDSVVPFEQYLDGLKVAIDKGANLNSSRNFLGLPALHLASWSHHRSDEVRSVLGLLLNCGADPNIESEQITWGSSLPNGTTPLIYTAMCAGSNPLRDPVQPAVVAHTLILHGAKIFHKNETGNTSLDYLLGQSGKTTFEEVWNKLDWQKKIVFPRIFDGQDADSHCAVVEQYPPGNIDSPQNAMAVELVINALRLQQETQLQSVLHRTEYDMVPLAHGLRDFVTHLLSGRHENAPVRMGTGREISIFRD